MHSCENSIWNPRIAGHVTMTVMLRNNEGYCNDYQHIVVTYSRLCTYDIRIVYTIYTTYYTQYNCIVILARDREGYCNDNNQVNITSNLWMASEGRGITRFLSVL